MIMKRASLFVINGTVSAVTSFLMSGIGVWFSLYLTKTIGTALMGQYQLLLSVYSFGITLASSGASFAAMRLISENPGSGHSFLLKKCFFYSCFFGFGSGILLYFLAPVLDQIVFPRQNALYSLRIMALSLPAIAVSGVIGGYFTAVRKVYKNSIIQICEQLLKICLTFWLLSLAFSKGEDMTCLALILASTIGEGVSFLFSYLLYRFDRKKEKGLKKGKGSLLRIALPIAFSSYLRSGLVTAKNLLVPQKLQSYGLSHRQAVSSFGVIHGILLPIALFPTSILFPFSNLMIPEVAEARTKSGAFSRRMTYLIDRSIQLTLLFSFGIAGFLFCFSEELLSVISPQEDCAVYLKMLALMIPVMYLDHTVDNMLKGLDEQVTSMKYNLIDSALSLILLFFLLPQFGIAGYVFLICFSECFNFSLSFHRLSCVSRFHLSLMRGIFLPLLCIFGSLLLGKTTALFLGLEQLPLLLTAGCVSFLGYLTLLRVTRCLTEDDIQWVKGIFKS